MKASLDLQLYDFEEAKSDFAFIPYGLKSDLSKEAVKVHVLNGRKRGRNPQKLTQKQNGMLQGQMFEWDSKTEMIQAKPKQKKRASDHTTSQDETKGVQTLAFVAQVPHARRSLHPFVSSLSLDDRILRNPFVEQMRNEFGLLSTSRVNSTNFLVDYYISRCGGSRFPHELLASYWQDSACFKAFLAHAATLFLLETGLSPLVNVEQLMCAALQEIRQRLVDPVQRQHDGTILAVAILANVEEGRAQRETAEWHWRGLKQLLRMRGSFSSLRMHRDLHTMLLWREILTSNSHDFCFGHGIHDHPELQRCNEHIVTFFDNFAQEISDPHPQEPDTGVQHFIVAILNRDSIRQCEWTSSMHRRSEIACLTYLAMLAISASVSSESRNMMKTIKDEVIKRDKWGPVDQSELLFIMLRFGNLEQEWRCQRLWQLSRCIFLTRNLDVKDWKTIRDILSHFLGTKEGCDELSDVLGGWKDLSTRLLMNDGCRVELGKYHATGREIIPT